MSWILYSLVVIFVLGLSDQQQTTQKRQNYVILTDGVSGAQRTLVERRCQYMEKKINYAEQKVTIPCVQTAQGTVMQNRYPFYGDGLDWRRCERTIQRPYLTFERTEKCCQGLRENADGLCVLPDNNGQYPVVCHNGGFPERLNGGVRCLCQPGFHGFVCEGEGDYPNTNYYNEANKRMQGAMQSAMIRGQMWRMLASMVQRKYRDRQMPMLLNQMNKRLSSTPPLPPLPGLPKLPYNQNERTPSNQERPKSFFKLLSDIYRARMMNIYMQEHPELRDQMIMLLVSQIVANKRRYNAQANASDMGNKIRSFLLDRKRKYAIAINKLNQLVEMKRTRMARTKAEMMNKMKEAMRMGMQRKQVYLMNLQKRRMLAEMQKRKMEALRRKFVLIVKYKLLQNMMANRPEFQELVRKLMQRVSGGTQGDQDDNDDSNKDNPDIQSCAADFDSSFKQCFVDAGLNPDQALVVTQGVMYGRLSADEQSVNTFRAVCGQSRNLEGCVRAPAESCRNVPVMAYVSQNIYRMFRVLDIVCQHIPQVQVADEEPATGDEDYPKTPTSMTCMNGGHLRFVEDRYLCFCPDGFSGTLCQLEGDEQPGQDAMECQNGGQLLGVGDVCLCPEGFSGRYCELTEADDENGANMPDTMVLPDETVDEYATGDLSNPPLPTDPFEQPPINDQMPPVVPDIIPELPVDRIEPPVVPEEPIDSSFNDQMMQLALGESTERQTGPYFTNCPTDIITLTIPQDSSVAQLPFMLDARDWRGTPLQWGISHTGFQWSSHSIETVVATARDDLGRLAKCVFSVTVTDPYPPQFSLCPQDITVHTDKEPVVWPAVEASDNVGLLSEPKGDHKSGSTFPVGRTLVTFVAEDLAGNVEYCKFFVDVEKSADAASSDKETILPELPKLDEEVKPIASKASADDVKDAKPVSKVNNPAVDTMMVAMLSVAVGVLVIAIVTAIIACACLKRRKRVLVIEKTPGDIPAITTSPPEYETKGIPPMFYEEAKGETLKGADKDQQDVESSKI